MSELIFVVEDAPEGGFIARALGASFSLKLTLRRSFMKRPVKAHILRVVSCS
jgi:hypothetical protein